MLDFGMFVRFYLSKEVNLPSKCTQTGPQRVEAASLAHSVHPQTQLAAEAGQKEGQETKIELSPTS